jgi:hypothetical protein
METYAASTSAAVEVPLTPKPDYEVEIELEYLMNGKPYSFPAMKVGETVRYFSKDGEVTIQLPGYSLFRIDEAKGTHVPGDVILTVVKSSNGLPNDAFFCGCSLKLPGKVVGWPELPNAGANQHVPHP